LKLPRDLSGSELARCLCRRWGYAPVRQKGSHHQFETLTPAKHRVTIPMHPALRVGTLAAILDAIARHKSVSREDLLNSL
jgi:predicted RNA binding protein YcfA (HicA-like mRNA interferase family)